MRLSDNTNNFVQKRIHSFFVQYSHKSKYFFENKIIFGASAEG